MSRPVLAVRDLAKSFGAVAAVRGVSFDLQAGEILALIGPNGAGKTTCFNLINGQLRPNAGRIELDGRSLLGLAPRRRLRLGLGRTFQIAAGFATLTVAESVQVALAARAGTIGRLWQPLREQHRQDTALLLDRLALTPLADRPCATLSYGDLKRVDLALALAGKPRVLLMDEPAAGIAPAERQALMALTLRLVREEGLSVLFVEHDMDLVFGTADRVLVMDRGQVIAAGPPAAIRADPRVRAVYLGVSA